MSIVAKCHSCPDAAFLIMGCKIRKVLATKNLYKKLLAGSSSVCADKQEATGVDQESIQ
jgi:hypothetical protein